MRYFLLLLSIIYSGVVASSVVQLASKNAMTLLAEESESKLISVSNLNDEEMAYVRVDVVEVILDEKSYEVETRKIEPDELEENIVVVPSKLVIPAGSKANVRVINMTSAVTKDRFYKVRFIPITNYEFNGDVSGNKNNNSVFFSISSSSFVTVLNQEVEYKYLSTEQSITNTGTGLMLLENCNICDEKDCKIFEELRLPINRKIRFNKYFNSRKGKMAWSCSLRLPNTSKVIDVSGNSD